MLQQGRGASHGLVFLSSDPCEKEIKVPVQSPPIIPWNAAAKAEMIDDLHLLFSATLNEGDEILCDMEGRCLDGSEGRSRIVSDLLNAEYGKSLFDMIFAIAGPEQFQVSAPEDHRPYRTNLFTQVFCGNDYSAHQRISSWKRLPEKLHQRGVDPKQIQDWLSVFSDIDTPSV